MPINMIRVHLATILIRAMGEVVRDCLVGAVDFLEEGHNLAMTFALSLYYSWLVQMSLKLSDLLIKSTLLVIVYT